MKAVVLEIKDGKAAVLREDGGVEIVRRECRVGETIDLSDVIPFPAPAAEQEQPQTDPEEPLPEEEPAETPEKNTAPAAELPRQAQGAQPSGEHPQQALSLGQNLEPVPAAGTKP